MEIGSDIPTVPVQRLVDGDIQQVDLAEFSAGKIVVLVAVPGAFTPTCSVDHVPGYLVDAEKYLSKGVDAVVILATSDFFAVKAWEDQLKPAENIHFMADGSQRFAAAAGQLLDLNDLGLGMRTERYAAVVRDGKVEQFHIEPDATAVTVTGSDAILAKL